MNFRSLPLLIFLTPLAAMGGGSTHYTLDPVTLDNGGRGGTSTHYTANFSASPGAPGTSTHYTVPSGFAGQLSNPVAIAVTAAPSTVDEGSTRQLSATLHFDDATTSPLDASSLVWNTQSGPITIAPTGLSTGQAVYQDTPAVAQGIYQTFDNTLNLTVLNTDPDNFGTYAGDGLGDDWQVNFFGAPPNTDAAPDANPDQDQHDNLFEYLTGYDPTDGADFFNFRVIDLTGATATIELSKIIPGTRYHLERSNDINNTDPWTEISNFTTGTETLSPQYQDPAATTVELFYRVGVEAE